MTDKLPQLLSSNNLCKQLGVSRITLGRMVKRGQIKPIRFSPKNHRFDINDVADFLNNSKS